MYSKNVGNDEYPLKRTISRQVRTNDGGFQTDLVDTQRQVGYLDKEEEKEEEDTIEEQRQEIITFRLPIETRTTEEIYETTVTTETRQNQEEIRTTKKPANSPEQLVEESYEVVSTVVRADDNDFLNDPSIPRTIITQRSADLSTTKLVSSEDDSSYAEEWTVTEAKRKEDGKTVKTIIDR